ncbi:MAG: dienelactone hydrolase family protein, partial [Planctomycetes bacterium]|nr:dienelactone hydrolase family protein [Planctomycetota bacterium]
MVQERQTGFVPQTLDFDGRTYRYSVFVPDDYTPERAWPAILFLHGAGERGDDGASHTTVGLGRAIRAHPERFECLVVLPQCPADRRWDGSMQELALATLDAIQAKYNVDPDRIALTGLSLGGYGTWSIGARFPERFCALLPICGGGDPARAEQLATVPIWCFHGEADPVVDVERSREMVTAVRAAGGWIEYSELPGVTHNSWDP